MYVLKTRVTRLKVYVLSKAEYCVVHRVGGIAGPFDRPSQPVNRNGL